MVSARIYPVSSRTRDIHIDLYGTGASNAIGSSMDV